MFSLQSLLARIGLALHRLLRAARSLQWQLAASYAAMAALLCTVTGLVIMEVLSQDLRMHDQTDVQNRAVIAADLIYRSLDSPQGPNLQLVLDEASQYVQARVCAYAQGSVLLACSSSGLNELTGNATSLTPDTEAQSAPTAIAPATPLTLSGESVFGYVVLSDPLTYRQSTEHSTQTAIFNISLVATTIAAVSGLLLGRGLTAPLRELSDAARQLGSGNLQARAPAEGDDEIGELGAQFNRMAAQLQESFATLESERDALRTFIADMSHELRTPITALRTFNDLLTTGAAEDQPIRDEFLAESGRQIERLEWLAQNLLDLSKFDAGLADMRVEPVDLRTVVERVAGEAKLTGEQKGIAVQEILPPEAVEAQVDQKRLEQALENVVQNSLKFTPAGGTIRIALQGGPSEATVRVNDTGPGIPEEELPHIFERFYRGPSTAATASGSGLGLPIVQSILLAHGGNVEVRSERGVGTEVVLSVPL